jgi:1,2-diacylglycerol 3-beta-galactosyltransferase
MTSLAKKTGKILFLFSDTGGGHRSAVQAMMEALELEFQGAIQAEMVDVFRDYAPPPLDRMPDLYPEMVRIPRLWGLGYRLSDGARRTRLIQAGVWPYVRRSIRSLLRQHPADLVVSAHPLANTPVLRAMGNARPPFITVVTDLVTAHMFWYDRRVDLCIVPTPEAAQRAAVAGLQPERVKVVGLPVAERFTTPPGSGSKQELRMGLGWDLDRPVVLLVGGGEGMGPLEPMAEALAQARLPVTLVVVAGRNDALRRRLVARRWPMPVKVYGFVQAMPDFMRAADILLTKAGPGTICEALIAGLPMVLYSRLPGQEEGNITYVTDHGAGVWAPRPRQVVAAVQRWINEPDRLTQASRACQALARPQAAREIARLLATALP